MLVAMPGRLIERFVHRLQSRGVGNFVMPDNLQHAYQPAKNAQSSRWRSQAIVLIGG
ncbi:MAG: hypothetical protein R3308_05275 [Thiohalobacterales bacterium]|nr:hypothetical protein [Thiohalobacterales bacterium]